MPSVILFDDGEGPKLHVSQLPPKKAAKLIADRFEGFSTDGETTSLQETRDDTAPGGVYTTVILTNEQGDDGSGPDHDLAHVLAFSFDAVAWALKQVNDDYDTARLKEAGVL